jgi:hypothetical protein
MPGDRLGVTSLATHSWQFHDLLAGRACRPKHLRERGKREDRRGEEGGQGGTRLREAPLVRPHVEAAFAAIAAPVQITMTMN